MNKHWRMWPLAANLFCGTQAVAVSYVAPYPRLTFGVGMLCYAVAAYVAVDQMIASNRRNKQN